MGKYQSKQSNQRINQTMSSSDTSDVEMKPRRRVKKKSSMDGQYRPSMEGKVPPKPKQRGAPKRPISAYFLYAMDVREEFKSNNPDLKMTALTKLIAAQWKTEDDKAKEEYKEKRAEYVASNKYKKWKKDVAEWNDRHKEEWLDQEYERKERNEERRKKRADKAKKAKKKGSGDDDKENKKKSKNKAAKKVTNKRRGRKKSK